MLFIRIQIQEIGILQSSALSWMNWRRSCTFQLGVIGTRSLPVRCAKRNCYRNIITRFASYWKQYIQSIYSLHSACPSWRWYQWDVTKFAQLPSKFWDDITNQRCYLDSLAKTLNVSDKGGSWLTHTSLLQHGGYGLLHKYNYSLSSMLSAIYPEYL